MPSRYFLDTYALVEIAHGNHKLAKYLHTDAITLKENLAELYYVLLKASKPEAATTFLHIFSKIAIDLPLDVISKAMRFRYHHHKEYHFSYIDALGYTVALKEKRIYLTGDNSFRNFPAVEFLD